VDGSLLATLRCFRICQLCVSQEQRNETSGQAAPHRGDVAHEGAVDDLAGALAVDEAKQRRAQALPDALVAHDDVAPEVQTQLVHLGLVLVLHVDAVHVLRTGTSGRSVVVYADRCISCGKLRMGWYPSIDLGDTWCTVNR